MTLLDPLKRGFLLGLALGLGACSKPAPTPSAEGGAPAAPTKIRFKTDWFPQAEHGGFYQAAVKGYYKAANLDVDIIPGGPGVEVPQLMLSGQADVAIGRSDDMIVFADQGLPFIIVGVYMEHDPQALLLHEDDPAKGFADLNNRSIMAVPGVHWMDYLQLRYHITLRQIPTNYGIAEFMADKTFIQQCFVTNEPYYVMKNGGHPKTFMLSESGYDPYRVIFSTQAFVNAHPEAVRAFIAASTRGWEEYMNGDPSEANAEILRRNENMTSDFIAFSTKEMRDKQIIFGKPELHERAGMMLRKRMLDQVDTLAKLKITPRPVELEKFVRFDLLPLDLQSDAK